VKSAVNMSLLIVDTQVRQGRQRMIPAINTSLLIVRYTS